MENPTLKATVRSLQPDFIQIPIVDGIERVLNMSMMIELKTLAEVLCCPDSDKYLDSTIAEIKAHLENGMCELAHLPQGK